MKPTSFIIAMLVVGMVVTTFSGVIINITGNYDIEYEDDRLETFQNTVELQDLSAELDTAVEREGGLSGFFDIVGSFISRAVSVLTLSKSSITTFNSMASASVENLGLPRYFLETILAIILVIFVLGIIVAVMVKWQL